MSAALRPPRGFHEQADGTIVCPHRNTSCCPACLAAHEPLVDVYGAIYWVPDPIERAEYDGSLTFSPEEIPSSVEGHSFEKPGEDCGETCSCGAPFYSGFNLQSMKVAHLKVWAAEAQR